MSDTMIVEINDGFYWKVVPFEDVMIGDKFRMRDPHTNEIYVNSNGKSVFLATSEPFLNEDKVWTIEVDDEEVSE
jgi:hypothetical protein